jgi:hypothetical protein
MSPLLRLILNQELKAGKRYRYLAEFLVSLRLNYEASDDIKVEI